MIFIFGTIVILAIALGGGWYISGHILRPMQERREVREERNIRRFEAQPVDTSDLWAGFTQARINHPPKFPENEKRV